jgi:hypothetical protein
MRLNEAINHSCTYEQLVKIFERDVEVQVDTFWGVDSVKIEGYEGTVSTDLIANHVGRKLSSGFHGNACGIETLQRAPLKLAELLRDKVFTPLRDRLKKLDRTNCMLTLPYKIRNCVRMAWTPQDDRLTGGYLALKHGTCVLFLEKGGSWYR